MSSKTKSLAGITALALALFLAPSLSSAQARQSRQWGRGPAFTGRVADHFRGGPFRGSPFRHGRAFAGPGRFGHRPFVAVRGFHRPFFRASFRPFRVVRVFVYDPFPHWVFRRIYYGCDPYAPYDPYCPY